MKCEICQQQEATIHLTQVVDGAVKKIHLCEACAAENGFDVHGPMSITDILLGLGGGGVEAPQVRSTERSCPRCHMRRADFKKTGRLGCPICYETFQDELTPLLRAMHRHERHTGKVPSIEGREQKHTSEVNALNRALEKAIGAEKYEEAARLRDELKDLRKADVNS